MDSDNKSEKDAYNKFMIEYAFDMTDEDQGELCLDVFYKYGPLTDQYWSFTPRILVCNIEPYDYREGIIDVNMEFFKNHWMKQVYGYNAQTPRNTARFITGLLKAIDKTKYEIIDFRKFGENELNRSLEKIAYLNFRVDFGEHVSEYKNRNIAEQIKVTGGYIKDQIRLLDPKIIIIGGVKNCKIFNLLYEDCKLSFGKSTKWDNKVICSINHFSRVKYETFSDKICEIIKLLNS